MFMHSSMNNLCTGTAYEYTDSCTTRVALWKCVTECFACHCFSKQNL